MEDDLDTKGGSNPSKTKTKKLTFKSPQKLVLKKTEMTEKSPSPNENQKVVRKKIKRNKILNEYALPQPSSNDKLFDSVDYFEADKEEEESKLSLSADLKPWKVFISVDQFFESLFIHSLFGIMLGPFLYFIFLPFRRLRNYYYSLGLCSATTFSMVLLVVWVSLSLSSTIRFGFSNIEVDDSQVYSLIQQVPILLIIIASKSMVTHFTSVEKMKTVPNIVHKEDFRFSTNEWTIHGNKVISEEIKDSVARQDLDTTLLYLNFNEKLSPSVFQEIEGFQLKTFVVPNSFQDYDGCKLS